MSLYRSAAAHARVRSWCESILATREVERVVLTTSLGATHVTRWGRGEVTVLVLPGTNLNAATSLGWATGLGSHVAVVDLPGQPGLSAGDRPDGDLVRRYRGWGAEVLAGLGPGSYVLVGESLGAAVALCWEPGTVEGLVLVAPGGIVPARVGMGGMRASLPWLIRPTPTRSLRLLASMGAAGCEPDALLVDWMTLVGQTCRTSLAPAPLPGAVLDGWASTPGLVLVGDEDCFFRVDRIDHRMQRRGRLPVRAVPGGHLLAHEDPGAVARAVRDVEGNAAGIDVTRLPNATETDPPPLR